MRSLSGNRLVVVTTTSLLIIRNIGIWAVALIWRMVWQVYIAVALNRHLLASLVGWTIIGRICFLHRLRCAMKALPNLVLTKSGGTSQQLLWLGKWWRWALWRIPGKCWPVWNRVFLSELPVVRILMLINHFLLTIPMVVISLTGVG